MAFYEPHCSSIHTVYEKKLIKIFLSAFIKEDLTDKPRKQKGKVICVLRLTGLLTELIFLEGGLAMNKSEMVSAVASKTKLKKRDAEKVINTVFEVIQEALAKDERVQLIGFGSFEVRERKAHQGRNPMTGETIQVKASKRPVFKAGKQLKALIK